MAIQVNLLLAFSILGLLPSCKQTDAVGKTTQGILCDFYLLYAAANITVGPSSVSALFGTLIYCNCKGIGDVLEWTLDGKPLTDANNQDRVVSATYYTSVNDRSSVLTIRALPIDGNSIVNIECTMISYSPGDQDVSGAILTVQGNLYDKY